MSGPNLPPTRPESQRPPQGAGSIRSLIPARLDRLPWSRFHTKLAVALGITWIFDGIEITVASSITGVLIQPATLNLSAAAAASMATAFLAGEVIGALVFGGLVDKWGRRHLFMITLGVYLLGSGLTALTLGNGPGWMAFLYATRVIAGLGLGGEDTAIYSALDELIPARYRGRVDITVNGTYWGGSLLGTLVTFLLLTYLPTGLGWRLGFALGPLLGLAILYVRRSLPESPRWQIIHGKPKQAEDSVVVIEHQVTKSGRTLPAVDRDKAIAITPATKTGYGTLLRVMFARYRSRTLLGLALMITQSFLYNAIFFTYALVLSVYYHISPATVPLYGLAFAVGNLAGPLALAPLFDTIGRKLMIAGTYLLSGGLLAVSAILFREGLLTATTQTAAWVVIFFFASAGTSAAYLTVSEIFPLEVRAKAIAVFYAIAQGIGAVAPLFFAALINKDNPNPEQLFLGYLIGATIMVVGGVAEAVLGIRAEQRSLEEVADPLSLTRDPDTSTHPDTAEVQPPAAGPCSDH